MKLNQRTEMLRTQCTTANITKPMRRLVNIVDAKICMYLSSQKSDKRTASDRRERGGNSDESSNQVGTEHF